MCCGVDHPDLVSELLLFGECATLLFFERKPYML